MIQEIKHIFRFINKHPLARRHKFRAYSKFFSWQFSQIFSRDAKIVEFIQPTRLLVKKGMTGATGNIYSGLHEFSEMGFLLHYLNPEDLFYDIGANVGTYSVLASGVKKAKVIAFEPVPTTFEFLSKNIEINNLESTAILMNAGAGSENTTMKFTAAHDTVNHVVADGEHVSDIVEVPVVRVDDMVLKHGCPAMMKIDVEGFESEVIKGSQNTLKDKNLNVIVIELNGSSFRYGFDESVIHQTLLSNGFSLYHYNPFERKLQKQENTFGDNSIYVRDESKAMQRLINSEPFYVFNERI